MDATPHRRDKPRCGPGVASEGFGIGDQASVVDEIARWLERRHSIHRSAVRPCIATKLLLRPSALEELIR
jgi:hypothetical protein